MPRRPSQAETPDTENVNGRRNGARPGANCQGKGRDRDQGRAAHIGEVTVLEALASGDVGDGPLLFLFEEDKFVDPGFYGRHPVHSVTTFGFLVGLERSGVITNADELFTAMRSNGREGVKAISIDRRHRSTRDGADTTWRP